MKKQITIRYGRAVHDDMKGANTMNELKIFENAEFGNVRIVSVDGEPWIVGKDVAQVLGYSNTRDALLRHVDDEDKNTVVNPDGKQGNPNLTIINESGLYSLCLSSKLLQSRHYQTVRIRR